MILWINSRLLHAIKPKPLNLTPLLTAAMSSRIDLSTIPEDQLAEALSKAKSSRETEALRARLPAQLAPFASNIAITKPIHIVSTSAIDGLYYSSFGIKERRIAMAVTVVPSPYSQWKNSEEPQPLELVWRDWWTSSKNGTGSADSFMYSLSLRYGPNFTAESRTDEEEDFPLTSRGIRCDRGKRWTMKAFTGSYIDPGPSLYQSSNGGIKCVAAELARDMGFRGGKVDDKLPMEVIEALLGDDGRQLLDSCVEEGTPLRKVIEDELEEDEFPTLLSD
jgi:hypothetical protein